MSNLLCLLLGFSIPLLALGLMLRRGMRPMAAAAIYRNIAWKLGLEADTRGTSIRGTLGGRRVFLGTVSETSDGLRGPHLRGVLDFAAPLGLGLRIRPLAITGRLRRRALTTPAAVDAELASAFELRAHPEVPLRDIFDDSVRDALLHLRSLCPDLEVTDDWVRIARRHPITREELLRAHLDALQRLATALEAARARVSPLTAVAEATQGWDGLAADHNLRFVPSLPAADGVIADREVRLTVRLDGDRVYACVRVTFKAHPRAGIGLHPQPPSDRRGRAGQDIQLGDPAFDDAFLVHGYDPATIRRLLTSEARGPLLTLAGRATLHLDDHRLELRDASPDAGELRELLAVATAAADALGW